MFRLFVTVAGIYLFYTLFGVAQEKLHKTKYEGASFHYTGFMVLAQCVANWVVGMIFLVASPPKKTTGDRPGSLSFLFISLSYLLAMYFTNACLDYVDFPTQVVAKSVKMVPVMLGGVIFLGKRYPLREYLEIAGITVGIVMFFLKRWPEASGGGIAALIEPGYLYGLLLAFLSLFMDGVTATLQDRLKAKHAPSPYEYMAFMNFWAVLALGAIVVATGELFPALSFLSAHPGALLDLVTFAATSAGGQVFIFYAVAHFGPLILSLITTTRKFFSILVSVMWFGHPLTNFQWCGAALVFAGIILHSLGKVGGPKKKHH